MHDIRSIHNVGSMFRTSDAAAVERIVLSGFTGTPEHRSIRKTALGAENTVVWTKADAVDTIGAFRSRGYSVAALEITNRPRSITDLGSDDFPLLLVIGNELHGLPDNLVEAADFALEIPQYGTKQSLNVSVAFGIAVFGLIERFRATANGSSMLP